MFQPENPKLSKSSKSAQNFSAGTAIFFIALYLIEKYQ